jgi:hypothetical protein
VVRGGAASGTVASTPAGIDCGATCAGQYAPGTVVTLTATPAAGAVFTGWGGACSGTLTSCSITLNASAAVNADFGVAQYAVTVAVSGNGTGSVTSAPGGITCPGACTTTVAHGSALVLTAAPQAGSTFLGWSGGACTGTGTCSVTVTSPLTINASFALNNSLVVTKAGNGAGGVTSSPAGINCGADCSEAYTAGTVVALTATPQVGSTFTGWSGAGCTGTGACSVTMTMSEMVTATFTLNQYVITVAKNGTGTGTVTSSPAGITCGADCTETVNHGSMTTLTAAAAAGSTFTGWSGGGCTGTGTCTITATATTTVTATFTLQQFTLTLVPSGDGVGTVTSSPAGIACGADCSEAYNFGTVVTLTASVVAGSGSTFTGWTGGGCTGTGTCAVTVMSTTAVRATFTLSGPGGALSFDGTDDIATLATSALLDTPVATIECWVNPGTVTGAAISLWGAGGGPDKYMLQFQGGAAPFAIARINRTGLGQSTVSTTVAVNAWNHFALVYDGTNLVIYKNGVQAATMNLPGTLGAASGPLRLGIEDILTTSSTFFRGQIDEVRVWNVVRTPAQISATFNHFVSPSTAGLVAYYHFDEVTGQSVLDATANSLDGNLGATAAAGADDPGRMASTAPVGP